MRIAARGTVAAAVLVVAMLLGQTPAHAAPTGYFVGLVDNVIERLYSVDLATGEATLVGNVVDVNNREKELNISAVAFGADGELYAVSDTRESEGGLTDAELYRIDTATGDATLVGSLGYVTGFTGLTFDEEGTPLQAGPTVDSPTNPSALTGAFAELSATTGAASVLEDDAATFMSGLAAQCSGTVFGLSAPIPVRETRDDPDTTTATIPTGPGGGATLPPGAGGPFVPSTNFDGQVPVNRVPEAQIPGQPPVAEPLPPAEEWALVSVDAASGAESPIGDTGIAFEMAASEGFPDIALDHATGVLHGIVTDRANRDQVPGVRLFTVDISTGAATPQQLVTVNGQKLFAEVDNLAIAAPACPQRQEPPPTTTTTPPTTTTQPDPPAAPPATPVPAQPSFTG
jgi:hypothetical protein